MKKLISILIVLLISPLAYSNTFIKGTLKKGSISEIGTYFTELPGTKIPFPKPKYEGTTLFIDELKDDISKKNDKKFDLKQYSSMVFYTDFVLKSYDKKTRFYKFELTPKTKLFLNRVNTINKIYKDEEVNGNILINGSNSCIFEGHYDYLRKELFPTKNTCDGINIKIQNKTDYNENFQLIVEKDIPISIEIT